MAKKSKLPRTVRQVEGPDGALAVIRQVRRHLYCLNQVDRDPGRNRWGTRKEIEEDAEFFEKHGRLPPPNGPRW